MVIGLDQNVTIANLVGLVLVVMSAQLATWAIIVVNVILIMAMNMMVAIARVSKLSTFLIEEKLNMICFSSVRHLG